MKFVEKTSDSLVKHSSIKLIQVLFWVAVGLSIGSETIYIYFKYGHLILSLLFDYFIEYVPVILFGLYLFVFSKDIKKIAIVPIIFGLLACKSIVTYYYIFYYPYSLIYISKILLMLAMAFSVFAMLKGIHTNKIVFLTLVYGIAASLFEILMRCLFTKLLDSIYGILSLIGMIGWVILYICMILYFSHKPIPAILPIYSALRQQNKRRKKKQNAKNKSPEGMLKQLNENYALGIITEEEYNEQRAEIIKKL